MHLLSATHLPGQSCATCFTSFFSWRLWSIPGRRGKIRCLEASARKAAAAGSPVTETSLLLSIFPLLSVDFLLARVLLCVSLCCTRGSKMAFAAALRLRLNCSPSIGKCRFASSRYNGVSWRPGSKKWIAQLHFAGQYFYVGLYGSEEEAAGAFDSKLRALCPDPARLKKSLNFPTASESSFRETVMEARSRGLSRNARNMEKSDASLRLVQRVFARSTQARQYAIFGISNASRVDAIFKPMATEAGGTQIQLKSASRRQQRSFLFQHVGGYGGMLLVLVALDADLIWAIPGHMLQRKSLQITIGSVRDVLWRVHDLGSVLERCFHSAFEFPHVSVQDALMSCSRNNQVEEISHLQLATVFSSVGLQLQKSFAGSMSIDSVLRGARLELQVQEKARNLDKRGRYPVDLSRRGGGLGKLAYRSADFDVLVATVLDELTVAGLFMFPTKVLERHALVDQKPAQLLLYPPWALPKRESARTKHAWQLDHFVDLRDWKGGDELPSCCRDRLLDVLQGLDD